MIGKTAWIGMAQKAGHRASLNCPENSAASGFGSDA
jgi:hypothetical protein